MRKKCALYTGKYTTVIEVIIIITIITTIIIIITTTTTTIIIIIIILISHSFQLVAFYEHRATSRGLGCTIFLSTG